MIRAQLVLTSFFLFGIDLSWSQSPHRLKPVREGDEIEVRWALSWYRGTVISYDGGTAVVKYKWGSIEKTGEFPDKDMRFPNGEGHWMIWKDASGKFSIEARYLSRTKDNVALRKADGSEIEVPISALSPALKRQLAKTPITGEENKINGANPIRVGDQVQCRWVSNWYDGIVKEIKPGLALIAYKWGSSDREREFKFEDIRFPNGEGPWQEWSDDSGSFKTIARYISRDENHVTLRREDGSDVRVEIARLSAKLRRELAKTPIVAPIPELISFAATKGAGSVADNAPDFNASILPRNHVAPLELSRGGVGFELPYGDSVSGVFPIGGPDQWVGIGTYAGSWKKAPRASQMFWVSPMSRRSVPGPLLQAEHRIIAYSANQSRMITARVRGTWDEPYEFCSFRVSPGESIAKAEIRWSIPESKGSSAGRSEFKAELVGQCQLLFGYGSTVSLYNIETQAIEYELEGLTYDFQIGPSGECFLSNRGGSLEIYNVADGQLIASQPVATSGAAGFGSQDAMGFSQDGQRIVYGSPQGIRVWDLTNAGPPKVSAVGGLKMRPPFGRGKQYELSLLPGGWISCGPQIYSTGLELLVWQYVGQGIDIVERRMLGRQLLAVGLAGNKPKTVLVGVATVPHGDAVQLMKKVDTSKLLMLQRGTRIRIHAPGDRRIADGLRRAAKTNGWVVDPNSDVVLTGTAGLGKPEKRVYRTISYGIGGGSGVSEHTVQAWRQVVEVRYDDKVAWGDSRGGVPMFFQLSRGETVGGKLSESSSPNYSLFENLKIPEEILFPRYQQGLGRTYLTARGFVDESSDPPNPDR